MSANITEYKKALKALKEAINMDKNDIVRDATIWRFGFCIELAWKCSKKVMGTNSSSPKSVIREMAQDSLIDDPKKWLKAIDYRNLSTHTYNEEIAEEVYSFIEGFLLEFEKLAKVLDEN